MKPNRGALRIALAIDDLDWHARALIRAFEALEVGVTTLRLADIALNSIRPSGLDVPGFEGDLPAAVLVRAVSGGSFEEVTRRLGVLHAFRAIGVPVWNDARAIERCVDKSMATFLLARAGLPTPATRAVEGRAAALDLAREASPAAPLVLKPLFGSQGKGLRLITCPEDLPEAASVGGVYYLQDFLHPYQDRFADHRLFVCDGEVVAAMTRHSDVWITNVRRGGRPHPLAADGDMNALAVRATECVGAAYAGVDLLRDRNAKLWVLEVNSMPGWRGLQRVTATSIANRIAGALLSAVK